MDMDEKERKRMRERNARRRRANRRKKIVFLVLISIIIVSAIIVIKNARHFKVKEGTLVRNISFLEMLQLENEPEGRSVSWESELPSFVKNDLKYCEANGLDIEYNFSGTKMKISQNDKGIWGIMFYSPHNYWNFLYERYIEFSMYKSKDSNSIVFYVHDSYDWFGKITVAEDELEEETLTHDTNLPFEQVEKSIVSMKIGDYSVFEENKVFYFYKDGELITTYDCDFIAGEFEYIDMHSGIAINTNKQLYMMYAEIRDNLPSIKFYYVDTVDSIAEFHKKLYCGEEDVFIPIVTKNGSYYAVVPEDWEIYKLFGFGSATYSVHFDGATTNYKVSLVELKQRFKEATFLYDGENWRANMVFELNGLDFETSYVINGYDADVTLPTDVAEKFELRVTSLDEFWQNIENLREAYFDYYDHEGE